MTITNDHSEIRRQNTTASIITTNTHGISCNGQVGAIHQSHMAAVFQSIGFIRFACTASAEDVTGNSDKRHTCITAEINGRAMTSIKEVTGKVIAVAEGNTETASLIPFHSVTSSCDGCHHIAALDSVTLIIGEPVIQHETIPAVNEQSISTIVAQHAVPNRKTPDMLQMHCIAGKVADPACLH